MKLENVTIANFNIGFPQLTGQFTDINGMHREINRLKSISHIKVRKSFS